MTQLRATATSLLPAGDTEAIRHIEGAIAGGRHWYIALLEAIGLWLSAEEVYQGRVWRYLIADEAFDWLLLAQRLCESADGLIPDEEKTALLFHGGPPLDITVQEFKSLVGASKYRRYLNYFYGVTVEEALVLAVQDEVRKEWYGWGLNHECNVADEVHHRIYGATRSVLLGQFRREKGYPDVESVSLTEMKEFTYWLFGHRLKSCEKAKVASDTRKGLDWLKSHGIPAMVD